MDMITDEKLHYYTVDSVMIGKRIKSARQEKGYTQEQLAEICHCSPTHISNIEHGKIGLSVDLLYAFSVILEKSMDYFVMDAKGADPRTKLDINISPKLSQCDTETLEVVNGFIDTLLTYRASFEHEMDELKKKYGIE